jgi:hypothetical protein
MASSKKTNEPSDTTDRWYYALDGAEYGPVDEVEVISLIEKSEIPAGLPVCKKGEGEWKSAREHPCFQVEVSPHKQIPEQHKTEPDDQDNSERLDTGENSSSPVVPVITVSHAHSGNPAGASSGTGITQRDFDEFLDTCKSLLNQLKKIPNWILNYLAALLTRGESLMKLGAWLYGSVLLIQILIAIDQINFGSWFWAGLLVQWMIVVPFIRTRDETMLPYAMTMAALVLTLQLGDFLGIQGALRYNYNMSSSSSYFLHDFSFTNIFLLLGVGLLVCGAWTAREAAGRNSTNIKL